MKDSSTGSLADADVAVVVRHQLTSVLGCYESALAQHPDLAGIVDLELRVDRQGNVSAAIDVRSTLADVGVTSCARHTMTSAVFPPSDAGSIVRVTVAFTPR